MKKIQLRKATASDAVRFESNLNDSERNFLREIYNYPDLIRIVECSASSFAVFQEIEETASTHMGNAEEMIGLIAIDFEPLCFPDYIEENVFTELQKYAPHLSPFNTFFLSFAHMFEGKSEGAYYPAMEQIALQLFKSHISLEALVFWTDKLTSIAASNQDFSDFLGERTNWEQRGSFKIFPRERVIPKVLFRKAREEDQDDLEVISSRQTSLDTSEFGNFFIAEIISSEDSKKLCLVAETQEMKAIGFSVTSADINYKTLFEHFDLSEQKMFVKSDFFEAQQYREWQMKELKQLQNHILRQQKLAELEFHKASCSKNLLLLELQEFCIANKAAFISEFKPPVDEADKQRTFNKNLIRRKLDKLLKGHRISIPNEIFAKELDSEVTLCTMSATDLLFEALHAFDLPLNYLDGEGHWSLWLKRKNDERNEEARQKGILSKKKRTKKKKDDNKENLTVPHGFDIEPFYVALMNFISTNTIIQAQVVEEIRELKTKLLELFCADNGELIEERVVDIQDIIELMSERPGTDSETNFRMLVPYVLFCFGNLKFDLEVQVGQQQLKAKLSKSKSKTDRILKKVSYEELFRALDLVSSNSQVFSRKMEYLEDLKHQFSRIFNQRMIEFLERTDKQFKCDQHLPALPEFDLHVPIVDKFEFDTVPAELQNTVCLSLFFINQQFEESSHKFLMHIFENFPDRDYLIVTLPHKVREFRLLQEFSKARRRPQSNFPHALFYIHRINVVNPCVNVILEDRRELTVSTSGVNSGVRYLTEYSFKVRLKVPQTSETVIGSLTVQKNLTLKQINDRFDLSREIISNVYGKGEVCELIHFKLHFVFQRLERFILREAARLSRSKLIVANLNSKELHCLAPNFFVAKNSSQLRLIEDEPRRRSGTGILEGECLFFATPKSLLREIERINSRIVVIGASSCALSFIDSLLCDSAFNFCSITLVSEKLDWEPSPLDTKPTRVENLEERYLRMLFELRVALVSGKVRFLDRKIKMLTVFSAGKHEFSIEYDYLIFANSLEEKTFENFCEKRGHAEQIQKPSIMIAIDQLSVGFYETLCTNSNFSQLAFVFKLDPHIFLGKQSIEGVSSLSLKEKAEDFEAFLSNPEAPAFEFKMLKPLFLDDQLTRQAFNRKRHWFKRVTRKWSPMQVAVYGLSIENCILLHQLMHRWGLEPQNIMIITPKRVDELDQEFMDSKGFSGDKALELFEKLTETPIGLRYKPVREFYLQLLAQQGVNVIKDYELVDFSATDNTITLKSQSIVAKEKQPMNDKKQNQKFGVSKETGAEKRIGQNGNSIVNNHESSHNSGDTEEIILENCLFVTGEFFDISFQTFRSIQDNGLVYNGRLIVQSNFQTIDDSIFAAGKICEFSQRYKNLSKGKSLRMDKYNQTEVGKTLARRFVANITGETRLNNSSPEEENLPDFEQVIGFSAPLYPGFFIVDLEFPFCGHNDSLLDLEYQVNNLLDTPSKEFVSLGFSKAGLLKRLCYFGARNVNVEALKNLMDLHKNYFNNFFSHNQEGLATSFIDFLDMGWAKVLFHPLFPKFKRILSTIALTEMAERTSDSQTSFDVMKTIVEEGLVDFISDHDELLQFYKIPSIKRQLN